MNDRDIYAAAKVMIGRFGEDTKVEVAMRADEPLEAGDFDSQQWEV
jgi:hypothetical protein